MASSRCRALAVIHRQDGTKIFINDRELATLAISSGTIVNDEIAEKTDVVGLALEAQSLLGDLNGQSSHNLGLAIKNSRSRLPKDIHRALEHLRKLTNNAKHVWPVNNTFIHFEPDNSQGDSDDSAQSAPAAVTSHATAPELFDIFDERKDSASQTMGNAGESRRSTTNVRSVGMQTALLSSPRQALVNGRASQTQIEVSTAETQKIHSDRAELEDQTKLLANMPVTPQKDSQISRQKDDQTPQKTIKPLSFVACDADSVKEVGKSRPAIDSAKHDSLMPKKEMKVMHVEPERDVTFSEPFIGGRSGRRA